MGGDCGLFKKINDLALIVIVAFAALLFIGANEIWRNEPNILTTSIRLLSIFPFVGLLAIWVLRKNISDYKVVLVCVGAMTLGMISNSIAILANDGRMPIDPALEAAGFPDYYVNGGNLIWLGDWLWLGSSPGDYLCYFSLILLGFLIVKDSIGGIKGRIKK